MTASVSTSAPAASPRVRPPTSLVDASTRGAVFLLGGGAVKWLIVGLVLGLVAGVKLHAPNLLAGLPALTYGRLAQAANAVLVYGFASQAALAVAIWLICRLGGTTLVGGGAVVAGGLFWNLGVLVGTVGILLGDSTGYFNFELPKYAMLPLFASYALIGVCALLTFASRNDRELYPSLWFVFAGLVFFPWIFSTAATVLWSQKIRGSAIPLIAAWTGNNIISLWLAPIAIAAVYYFIPKTSNRALANYGLAAFGFWLTVILSQSTALHQYAAFPRWVGALSMVATWLMLLPVAANFMNWTHSTARVKDIRREDLGTFAFMKAAAFLYLATAIVAAIGAHPKVNQLVAFTIFQMGLQQMALLGFIGVALLGALHYILSRAMALEWPCPSKANWHRRLTVWGAVLIFAPLLLGGLLQGAKLADDQTSFIEASKFAVRMSGLSFIGAFLMIGGQIAFLWNLKDMAWQCWWPGEVRR